MINKTISIVQSNTLIDMCYWILENLYPLGTSKLFKKTQNISDVLNFFLHIWIKQLLRVLADTQSFFFLGDMDDYILLSNMPKR